MNQNQSLHLIRHSITEGNKKSWFYGHTDVPLLEEGIALVQALAKENIYPTPPTTAYYTSGLLRTEETFALIYGQTPHHAMEDFKEMNFGIFEGKTYKEIKDDPLFLSWSGDKSGSAVPPGGESFSQFSERVKRGLASVLAEEAKDAVVVCHGGVIAVIMEELFPKNMEIIYKWIPDTGHGYTISFENRVPIGYTPF